MTVLGIGPGDFWQMALVEFVWLMGAVYGGEHMRMGRKDLDRLMGKIKMGVPYNE